MRVHPAPEGAFRLIFLTVLSVSELPLYLRAGAAPEPAIVSLSTSNSPAAEEGSPQRLKEQVRITVETNLPPTGAVTNQAAAQEKSFRWKATWEGWNGLHTEISQKTPINDPMAEIRAKIEGTNAYRMFRLEEVKMSGKIGAKLAVDGAAYVKGNQFQDFGAGVEVRRARIYAKGDCILLLPVSYELELGYIPNQFYIEKSYLAFKGIPYIGQFRIGQYQAPMGLDAVTSTRDIAFMEPPSPIGALAPGVNAGVEIGRPLFRDRVTWTLGLFTSGVGTDFGDASQDYGRAIARITALPIDHPEAEGPGSTRLLHLGLSANLLYSGDSIVRYRSRPESHLAPYVVDTGEISAQGALVAGAEAAWVNGPFSVQGEYLHSFVDQHDGPPLNFDGCYASVGWFLTGESRPYNRLGGCFARVIPRHDFNWGKGGWGAWEVAGRFSFVNLNSGDIQGGRMSMFMTGLNWYLHSHVKWRFDYGLGHVAGRTPEGYLSIFQTRVEVDF